MDDEWGDTAIPEDAEIADAHPTKTGRHDLYTEAMRLVGAKRSKGALVDLTNWLLHIVHETPRSQALMLKRRGYNDAIADIAITLRKRECFRGDPSHEDLAKFVESFFRKV